jgi:hypothetical protein
MTRMTDTQLVVLSAAVRDADGVVRLPEKLRGGAAEAVLNKLTALGFIERREEGVRPLRAGADIGGGTGFRITRGGLDAIGVDMDDGDVEQASTIIENKHVRGAAPMAALPSSLVLPRPGSKAALVVGLVSPPEGAGISDLVAATGWLPHGIGGVPIPGPPKTISRGSDRRRGCLGRRSSGSAPTTS